MPIYNIGMDTEATQYDPRYLAGIVLFNRGDFFEAHEVWESLWMETFTPEKKFYQGLIQAAVGLCHFCNGNGRGAIKLYKSSHDYMKAYEETIRETATEDSPWYVVPADNKWFTRVVVAAAVIDALASLNLRYPKVGAAKKTELAEARKLLDDGK